MNIEECCWCGSDLHEKTYKNRNGEVFCSKSHRNQSNAALRRLRILEDRNIKFKMNDENNPIPHTKNVLFIYECGGKYFYAVSKTYNKKTGSMITYCSKSVFIHNIYCWVKLISPDKATIDTIIIQSGYTI